MQQWWNKLSIKSKLQIPIQLILFIIMLFVQRFAMNKFEDHVLDKARYTTLISADGVLNGLNMLMINGIISNTEQRSLYVETMGATEKLDELRVIRGEPVVRQYGAGLASEQPTDALDRAALESGKVQIQAVIHDDHHALRVVVPFIAQKNFRSTNCLMCHSVPAGTVTGAASVTMDISEEYALISKVNMWSWVLQLLLQVLLYFLIGKLIQRITAPVLHSADAANRIASGDLSSTITLEGEDEVGRQLMAMQSMQNSLRTLVHEIKSIAQAAVLGNFSVRIEMNGKVGYNKELAELLNQLCSTVDDAFKDTVRVTEAIANGDLDQKIHKDYSGAYDQVKHSVNTTALSLTRLVKEIKQIVEDAAVRGDFSSKMALEGKVGYNQELAELFNKLSTVTETGINDVVRVASALAQGDLTQTITQPYPGSFGAMSAGINATVEQLRELIEQIREATDAINTASREIAMGNQDLSNRTEHQAANLEKIASSMEELTTTVKQNAENAQQANRLAIGAADVTLKGSAVVGQVVTTMDSINESSRKIVDIISVIDGIAFQTNILALNAAVEAARAGEQGRGFAVVAGEVRNLAQRSAAAAKEIKSLIGDSVEKVENGSKLVTQAGKTMDEILASNKRVTDIMSEIVAASMEQSAGIEQVNRAIAEMDDATQQNAALVEEAAAAAKLLEAQAQGLVQHVSVFKMTDGAPIRYEPLLLPDYRS